MIDGDRTCVAFECAASDVLFRSIDLCVTGMEAERKVYEQYLGGYLLSRIETSKCVHIRESVRKKLLLYQAKREQKQSDDSYLSNHKKS